MERKFIKDFQEDMLITGYYAVASKNVRKTKTNKEYLDLTLVDKTGTIDAKIWDNVDTVIEQFEKNDPVAVKARVTSFNNELQLNIDSIRRVIPDQDKQYGFRYDDLIPCTDRDVDQMWQDILDFIQTIQNPKIRQLVLQIYNEHAEALKTHPASMILHHAFRGGLLEHTHTMIKIANGVCVNYPNLDRDLVFSGVLLHDIGKLVELEPGLATDYSDAGNFVGHVVLGRDILLKGIARIEDFPELIKLKLEHIILSHQGKLEWQSPKEPMFPEALVVFFIDELDTRINQMQREIETDKTEGAWTSKNNYFHRPLYKGDDAN